MTKKVKNGIFFSVLSLSFLAVIGSFIYFYLEANSDDYQSQYLNNKKIDVKIQDWGGGWIDYFYKNKQVDNQLPVDEVDIQLDKINGYSRTKYQYQFMINNIDEYGFFCAKQVFENYNRPYSYYNKENYLIVNFVCEDRAIAQNVLQDLKDYNLKVEVKQ